MLGKFIIKKHLFNITFLIKNNQTHSSLNFLYEIYDIDICYINLKNNN